MSLRQDVFSFLAKTPDTSIDELRGAFSTSNTNTIKKYYMDYVRLQSGGQPNSPRSSKRKKKRSTTRPRTSARQLIANRLSENPETSVDELASAFPKLSRKTIFCYRSQWRTQQKGKGKVDRLKQKVLNHLDNNPDINLSELKKIFPELGNKLITFFRYWKSIQKNGEAQLHQPVRSVEAKTTSDSPENAQLKGLKKLVEKREKTLKEQNEQIENLRLEIESLKRQLMSPTRGKLTSTVKRYIARKLKI